MSHSEITRQWPEKDSETYSMAPKPVVQSGFKETESVGGINT